MSTLSVEISNRGSSASTRSPSCFSQRVIVPSVIDSPSSGILTGVAMAFVAPSEGPSLPVEPAAALVARLPSRPSGSSPGFAARTNRPRSSRAIAVERRRRSPAASPRPLAMSRRHARQPWCSGRPAKVR